MTLGAIFIPLCGEIERGTDYEDEGKRTQTRDHGLGQKQTWRKSRPCSLTALHFLNPVSLEASLDFLTLGL